MSKDVISINSTDIKVIDLLKTDSYVSGEFIAKELGLSRTSVWKTVKKVSKLGMLSDATSGKGYTLAKDIKLLNKSSIDNGLSVEAQSLFNINVSGVVDSTNTVLFEAAKEGKPLDYNVLVAEQQKHGKGRLGRKWVTPFAHQLAFSCHMKLDTGMASLYGMSIAVGICVMDAFKRLGIEGLGLKWPNDIYTRDNKKVGGILIEMQQEAEGPIHLVIGVGINCLHNTSFDSLSDVGISSLENLGVSVDRNILCSEILNSLSSLYVSLMRKEILGPYLDRWNEYNIYAGKQITVHKNNGEKLTGDDAGIDTDGALMIESESGLEKLYGNLCSIRLSQ